MQKQVLEPETKFLECGDPEVLFVTLYKAMRVATGVSEWWYRKTVRKLIQAGEQRFPSVLFICLC